MLLLTLPYVRGESWKIKRRILKTRRHLEDLHWEQVRLNVYLFLKLKLGAEFPLHNCVL